MHRDLAVRNIMVGANNRVKIGDFGMAKVIPVGQARWRMKAAGKLPVRYMPPESLDDKAWCWPGGAVSSAQVFNEASDVWSFGVAQWEMMTYGDTPYLGDNIEIAKIPDYVIDGGRLKFPPVRRASGGGVCDVRAVQQVRGRGEQQRGHVDSVVRRCQVVLGGRCRGPAPVRRPVRVAGAAARRVQRSRPGPRRRPPAPGSARQQALRILASLCAYDRNGLGGSDGEDNRSSGRVMLRREKSTFHTRRTPERRAPLRRRGRLRAPP